MTDLAGDLLHEVRLMLYTLLYGVEIMPSGVSIQIGPVEASRAGQDLLHALEAHLGVPPHCPYGTDEETVCEQYACPACHPEHLTPSARIGPDGLTPAQRAEYARRFTEENRRVPTSAELHHYVKDRPSILRGLRRQDES